MITNGRRRFHEKTEPDDTSEQHRRILGNAKSSAALPAASTRGAGSLHAALAGFDHTKTATAINLGGLAANAGERGSAAGPSHKRDRR
jgi:hypothetical protein